MGKFLQFLRKSKGDKAANKATQIANDVTRFKGIGEKSATLYRAFRSPDDGDEIERSDSDRDFDESGQPTKMGLRSNSESLTGIPQSWKQYMNELLPKVGREIVAVPDPGEDIRESFSICANDIDRQQRQAERIDDLEGVYNEEKDPYDTIRDNPESGMAVAANCRAGYRGFPLEKDKISTCVFESLVEPECYAGSRQPTEVDLGVLDLCLYYSLDFFLTEDTCRTNYERVYYQGRWTCRWDELGPNQPAWYTLHKPEDDDEEVDEPFGEEWIKAQNVDCHVHRPSIQTIWPEVDLVLTFNYSGECNERKADGHGTAVSFVVDPTDEERRYDGRYVGVWSKGRMTGQGTKTARVSYRGETSSYRVQEGEFVDGLLHGEGTVTESFGSEGVPWTRWEGEWHRHVLRQGVITRNDGSRHEGEFRNWKLWNGTYTDSNGNIIECREGRSSKR